MFPHLNGPPDIQTLVSLIKELKRCPLNYKEKIICCAVIGTSQVSRHAFYKQ